MVEDFYIENRYWRTVWKNYAIENTLRLQLLLPFTAVKNLYLSKEFAPGIVATLQELVGGRITEVLPSLQNIFVEGLKPSGPFQENIRRFVAARRLSGYPIVISDWDKDSNTSRSTFSLCPLMRQVSINSTSSLRTNATPTHPPVLPPLNISPLLDSRSVYPPVSHRAGQQLVSSVYGDAGSEHTGSFVTARPDPDDEDAENDMVAPFAHPLAGYCCQARWYLQWLCLGLFCCQAA